MAEPSERDMDAARAMVRAVVAALDERDADGLTDEMNVGLAVLARAIASAREEGREEGRAEVAIAAMDGESAAMGARLDKLTAALDDTGGSFERGRRAGMEEACRAACAHCGSGNAPHDFVQGIGAACLSCQHCHRGSAVHVAPGGVVRYCDARAIRALIGGNE